MYKLNATIETAGITSPHQDLQYFQTPSMIRCTYSHGNNQRCLTQYLTYRSELFNARAPNKLAAGRS